MSAGDRSIDQERAEFAWAKVGESPSDAFKNLASGAPALIMSNGLMQVLAFYREKNGPHHKQLLGALIEWLSRKELGVANADYDKVMRALHEGDSDRYFRCTEEALELLRWIRQFAKARGASGAGPT